MTVIIIVSNKWASDHVVRDLLAFYLSTFLFTKKIKFKKDYSSTVLRNVT